MNDQNVQPAKPADQPDPFAEVAAALYRIADDIVTLTGSGLPKIGYIQLSIQPGKHGHDDLSRRAVDAVTSAILGHPGQVELMGGGAYHYSNGDAAEPVGPVGVRIMQAVSPEWAMKNDVVAAEAELAEREAEWKKARNRLIELRGQRADDGLTYSREPESTVVAPVPADVEGHPEGGRALIHVAGCSCQPGSTVVRCIAKPGLIVGDTADEQRDNANAAYERDEAAR